MKKGSNYSPRGNKMFRSDGSILDVAALLEGIRSVQQQQLALLNNGGSKFQLTGSSIPDLESVPIHAVEAIETVGYFNSPVIMPDVSTELAGTTTGSPSISVDISNAKNIGVFADLKTAVADEDLVFEVSHDNSTWFAFETKNFATPSSRYNYFALASGGNILANYIRVTPKNNDGSAITLPYIILVIKG